MSPIRCSIESMTSLVVLLLTSDKKLYQLPDQQFANLYWFRYDWFSNPGIQGQVQG